MTRGDPVAGLYTCERGLDVAEVIEGVLGKTALAFCEFAAEAMDEGSVLGDEIPWVDPISIGTLKRLGEASNNQERRVALPVDKAGDGRGADSRFPGEPGDAFEGEPVVVSHHVGKPIDGRSEDLGV
jgi:hypothetical protein